MAFAKHLIGKYFSADGLAHQIWLDEEAFGGSEVDVDVRADPVVIEWGKRGIDTFSPIRGSRAKIHLWNTSDTADDTDDLLATSSQSWRARIVTGTSQAAIDAGTWDLYWQGFLVLDDYEDDIIRLPHEIDVECIDGFSLLKNIPYTDTSGASEAAYTGRDSLKDIFVRCVNKIGHSLAFNMASRIFADGVAKTVDPWATMEADNAVYYDDNGTAADCYTVLKDILYRMGAIAFQWGGEWWAVSMDVIDGLDYDVYQYDSSGTSTGTTTHGVALDVDAGITAGTINLEAGKRKYRQPVGLAQIKYNHGIVPSLIDAGDFEGQFTRGGRGDVTIGVDPTTVWTLSGPGDASDPVIKDASGARYNQTRGGPRTMGRGGGLDPYYTGNAVGSIPAFAHGLETDPTDVKEAVYDDARSIYQLGEELKTGQKIAFTGRIRIIGDENLTANFQAYWWIGLQGTTHYFSSGETWEDWTGNIYDAVQWIAPPGDVFGERGLRLNTWYDFEFIASEGAPADGNVELFLWGTSDLDLGSIRVDEVQWDDLAITLIDEDGDTIEAALTQVYIDETKDDERDVIDVMIGPGPTEFMDSRVTWGGAEETDFESDLITPAVDFDQLIAETWLRFMNRFLENRFETYKKATLAMGQAVARNSTTFFPVYLSKSLRHDRDEVELVIHEFDSSPTVVVGTVADSDQEFVRSSSGTSGARGTGGGGSSNVAEYLSTFNPIALLNDDYASGDTILELTVDAVTDAGLRDNDEIVVVDKLSGAFARFKMSAAETDVTWDVDDPANPGVGLTIGTDLTSGSGIYFANDQLLAILLALDVMTTTGDIIVYGASGPVRVGVGTDDQVLTADSGVAAGVAWKDLDTSPITTKGDLVVGDAAGDDERLGVSGTDRSILIEDSGEAVGVKWSSIQLPATVFSGKFNATNPAGDAKQYTVTDGWITDESDPPPVVESIFYITDPAAGTNGDLRKLTP